MDDLLERGAQAVYEKDPVLRPPSWTETVHWNDLLENTRQTSREQFKAALAIVAEWLGRRKHGPAADAASAIRQQIGDAGKDW